MIQYLRHSSESIKDFPMGDSPEREVPVFLPPGYDPKRSEAYPVVFFLAGWGARGSKYLADDSIFNWSFPRIISKAIQDGSLPPMICVFPDGSSKLGCSQYVNSPALGNYLDYICDELVPLVDENFHTHADANYRAVTGHSSGGFGALICGMKRPDIFKVICSSAGDSFFEVSVLPGLSPCLTEIEKAGGVENFLEDFLSHPNPSSLGYTKFITMLTLSLAPCYAPNPSKPPLYGDLFFDVKTGEIIPEVWERYLKWDPVRMIDKHQKELKSLSYVLLECGLQDEYAAQWGHRQIAEKLKKLGVSYELNEYPVKHSGQNWRFQERLSKMLKAMK